MHKLLKVLKQALLASCALGCFRPAANAASSYPTPIFGGVQLNGTNGCNAGTQGEIQYNGSQVQLCNGQAWIPFELPDAATVRLTDYGVDANGSVDACASVVPAALAALPAAGGVILIPPGDIKLGSSCLAVVNKPVFFEGMGVGVSRIHCYSATGDCISVSDTDQFAAGFAFLTVLPEVAQTSGSGLHINYANAGMPGTGPKTVSLHSVQIGYVNNVTNYFQYGIECNSCTNGIAVDLFIYGKNANASTGISSANMLAGILETGHTIAFTKSHFYISSAQYGIFAAGDVQGNQDSACDIIGVNYGWYYADSTYGDATSVAGDPGPEIENCNIAAYMGGFVSKGWNQTTIEGSTFYKRPDSSLNFTAVSFLSGVYAGTPYGSNQNLFSSGNQVYGMKGVAPGGTAEAVKFDQYASGNVVEGDYFTALDNIIDFNGGVGAETIKNNTAYNIGTGWAVGLGAGCSIAIDWRNNTPVNVGTVTTDAALPTGATPCINPGATSGTISSVQGQDTFFTTNTTPTTVTNLMTPYYGRAVTIVGNDGGNTTLQQNAGMILKGGVNVTLASGNAVTLQYNGLAWREISRNF